MYNELEIKKIRFGVILMMVLLLLVTFYDDLLYMYITSHKFYSTGKGWRTHIL